MFAPATPGAILLLNVLYRVGISGDEERDRARLRGRSLG